MRNSMFNAANIFYCCEAWGNKHFEKRFNYPSIEMNLSDHTSNDSSVRVGRDNDMFAGHQELNLSVSSNDQIGKHPHEELDHDLMGENQRLREEDNAPKQRISELEGGASDRENDMKPWSQLSGEWKRVRTSGIVTQIDRLAGHHQTSAVTIAANIMKRKARVLKLTDIHTLPKKLREEYHLTEMQKAADPADIFVQFFFQLVLIFGLCMQKTMNQHQCY